MDRSINSDMRRAGARSFAFEQQRQHMLEQIVSIIAQVSVRQRPLPRLVRRAEVVATLARAGLLRGPLSPDPNESGKQALLRFARIGYSRVPNLTPLFDPEWYRALRHDPLTAGVNPALHYALRGFAEPY